MVNGHIMEGMWALPGEPTICINIREVIDLIKLRQLTSRCIKIGDIAFKDLSVICTKSSRYLKANTTYPVIVVKDMVNPFNKPYRLIDGRHRLLKYKNKNEDFINAYVLNQNDIKRFFYYV